MKLKQYKKKLKLISNYLLKNWKIRVIQTTSKHYNAQYRWKVRDGFGDIFYSHQMILFSVRQKNQLSNILHELYHSLEFKTCYIDNSDDYPKEILSTIVNAFGTEVSELYAEIFKYLCLGYSFDTALNYSLDSYPSWSSKLLDSNHSFDTTKNVLNHLFIQKDVQKFLTFANNIQAFD